MIDELLAGASTEEEIVGPGGLLAQLSKRLVERAMEVELTDHLGYEPHQEPPGGAGNTRNGGDAEDAGYRSRAGRGSARRVIVTAASSRRSFARASAASRGLTTRSWPCYSRGLSTRDIEAHLEEIYGVKVGRDLISRVTDAVMDDVRAWQQRPLEYRRGRMRAIHVPRRQCPVRRDTPPRRPPHRGRRCHIHDDDLADSRRRGCSG